MRLEAYLSTQPPAPSKNARLSHSYEYSGRAQCVEAPPSEEPSSLDSLKSSFDLSSFPQDFSAATPKRVSASIRRRAAPQRVIMHGLLPAQRLTSCTPGHHHAGPARERSAAQSPAAACARSISFEFAANSEGMGHPGESARGGGEGFLHGSPEGAAAALSPAASANAWDRTEDREQVTKPKALAGKSLPPASGHWSPGSPRGGLKLLALALIRFYQVGISPLLLPACRHYPTCSIYAFEAIEKWGVWKGGRMALGRILRCRPWGSFGYDPVPEKLDLGSGI